MKMMNTRISREEIFSKDRDELFISRLCADMSRLSNAGFNDSEIKNIIGTFDYVRVYANTPSFLYPELKLPKGYAWRDGEKHKITYGKKDSVTYVFLPIGKDLWIKGITVAGTHIDDPKIAYISNYKSLNGKDVASHFDYALSSLLLNYWHDNGLDLGFIPKITRAFDVCEFVIRPYRQIDRFAAYLNICYNTSSKYNNKRKECKHGKQS